MAQFGGKVKGDNKTQANFSFDFITRVVIDVDVVISGASVYLNALSPSIIKTVIYADKNNAPAELLFTSHDQAVSEGDQLVEQFYFDLALSAGVYWIGTLNAGDIQLYFSNNKIGERSWLTVTANYEAPENPFPANSSFMVNNFLFSLFLEAIPVAQPQFIQMSTIKIGPVIISPQVTVDEDSGRHTAPVHRRISRV